MESKTAVSPERDLAMRIYVQLIALNAEVAEGKPRLRVSAESLSRMSIDLARVFGSAVKAADAATEAPKTGEAAFDISGWMK